VIYLLKRERILFIRKNVEQNVSCVVCALTRLSSLLLCVLQNVNLHFNHVNIFSLFLSHTYIHTHALSFCFCFSFQINFNMLRNWMCV
jgi:hypothetical protein